jgi:hypothetical protein
MRLVSGPVLLAIAVAAADCATVVTREQVDRCLLAPPGGDDAHRAVLGRACRTTAERLADDARPREAVDCARRACELGDAHGCGHYLWLTHEDVALPPANLAAARAAGERVCEGDALPDDLGRDMRPLLCERAALLYRDRAPTDEAAAGRLYSRACKLGDDNACRHALAVGVGRSPPATRKGTVVGEVVADAAPAAQPSAPSASTGVPTPQASGPPAAAAVPALSPRTPPRRPCHDMRDCVTLSLWQRSEGDLVGTLTSRCERPVACTWCPARGDDVDRSACRSATLAPGERRYGQSDGLYYTGFRAIAYDCADVDDEARCRSL